MLVVGGEIERASHRARGALAIVEELLQHDARDDRQIRGVARLQALDDRALARHDVRLAARRLRVPSFVATMPPASRSTTRRKIVPGS